MPKKPLLCMPSKRSGRFSSRSSVFSLSPCLLQMTSDLRLFAFYAIYFFAQEKVPF